jgi:hypothetical protein
MTIPCLNGISEPILKDFNIIHVMPFYRSTDDDTLHGFGHVEPRACTGGVQEANSTFMAPMDPIVTGMACQIVQKKQHA